MTPPIILAVDDRPDNLFVLEQLIGEFAPDCRVITANSAERGIELAIQNQIDLALLDVQMPGMDGLEMCRQLKAHDTTKHVPVILMTAHRTSTELRVRGLEAGADDFISKPVDNAELGARIKVMLRIKKAEDLLRRERDGLEEAIRVKTRELRESQGRYQTLAEMSPVGIFRTDPQGDCVYVNERWCGISGLTTLESLGRGWLRSIDPQDRERVAREWDKALKENTGFFFRIPIPAPGWNHNLGTGSGGSRKRDERGNHRLRRRGHRYYASEERRTGNASPRKAPCGD